MARADERFGRNGPSIRLVWRPFSRAIRRLTDKSSDVTSRDDLHAVVQGIRCTLPPLAGIAQGMALFEDSAPRNMTHEIIIKSHWTPYYLALLSTSSYSSPRLLWFSVTLSGQ